MVGCDAAQAETHSGLPGFDVSAWHARLSDEIGAAVEHVIVAGNGAEVAGCASTCGETLAMINHVRWPDGVADQSGIDYEPRMLEFLRDHPLP
jgi:hypothetical protein